MTNRSPSLPNSAEVSSSWENHRKTILELLEEVVEERVFSDLHNEAELLGELQSNPKQLEENIRSEMNSKLLLTPSGYTDFWKKEIDNLPWESILEKFRIFLASTISWQKNLEARVLSMFSSDIFNADRNPKWMENIQRLSEWIKKQNEKDIMRYMKSPILLRKKLRQECFGSEIDTFISSASLDILAELWISDRDLTPEEKEACAHIFDGIGIVGDGHIQTYLLLIDRANCSTSKKLKIKKDILKEHYPLISPRDLVKFGVIDESEARAKVKVGLEAIFWVNYFSGTPEEKVERQRFLEDSYLKWWYIELPIDEYLADDTKVEKLFAKNGRINPNLTEKMREAIQDAHAERGLAQLDFGDMKIKPDVNGKWNESFIENLPKIKDKSGNPIVANPQNFQPGSFICVTQEVNWEQKIGYYEIVSVDEEMSTPVEGMRDSSGLPVKHRGIRFVNWTRDGGMAPPGGQWSPKEMEYAKVFTLLWPPARSAEIVTGDQMMQRRSSGNNKITTAYDDTDTYTSIQSISEALGWTPEKGEVYTTKWVKGWADFFIEVTGIDESRWTITISDGVEEIPVGFGDFVKHAKDLQLKSVWKYDSETQLTEILHGLKDCWEAYKGYENVFVEEGVIKQTIKDAHGHDIKVPIHHFMNEDSEGMYVSNISTSGCDVGFGKINDKNKDWSELKGKVNLGKFTGSARRLSIVWVINQIRDNGYAPYMNPKDQPEIDHEGHMPHTHGSIWGKIMNGTSVSDMKKAFDLYIHAWEHKMEKNSKFQSAKFADKYLRKFMPEGFSYQLRSEAYTAQNEAMEGILKMLENDMSGKEARLYVRKKILLNDDAKFEEVLAGLLYISKKTGQLYPEELSDLKNSQLWFHKLAVTQGYTSKESRNWLKNKCIEKTDKSASWVEGVTEMDLVERQLKYYEGIGKRLPPNIAPKFPGALNEGKKSNQEKWELEVNQRSNIQQMNKYALSKGNVGEWWKAFGTIDRLHTKNGSPVELNAIPFIMVMSNAPEYMGSEFRKALHGEWNGARASHAFKFGNEMSYINIYRSVVGIAAKEVERRVRKRGWTTGIVSAIEEIEKKRSKIGNESHSKDTEDDQKKWVNSIFDFWMKYGDDLQPILQMSDTFIDAQALLWNKGNEDTKLCSAYKSRYAGMSAMQNGNLMGGGAIYKNSNVWEGNMIPNHTPFAFTNMANAAFSAIYSQSGQMGTSSSGSNDTAYGKIFRPWVIGALDKLRNMTEEDTPPWISLEAAQYIRFREYYTALMYYLRTKGAKPPERMIGGTDGYTSYEATNYIMDLNNHGFRLKKSDFRNDSSTVPYGAEEAINGWPSPLVIDTIDENRCKEMFQEFLNTSSNVTLLTSKRASRTVSWDNWG
jgi:hypothetical protein